MRRRRPSISSLREQGASYHHAMTDYPDNPAERLLVTLNKLAAPRNNELMVLRLAQHVKSKDVEKPDFPAIFATITRLFELSTQTKNLVSSYPDDDPRLLLEGFEQIDDCLAKMTNLLQSAEACFAPFNQHAQYTLRLCSSLLHRRCPEMVISSGKALDIIKLIKEVRDELKKLDDLDPDVREWVSRRLREIAEVLDNYEMYGAVEVREAAENLIGGLVNKERIAAIGSSRIAHSLLAVITALDLALNMGANVRAILPAPPQQSSEVYNVQIVEVEGGDSTNASAPSSN